jgi:thiol-disulfide isomerase/thioredoxin
MMKKFYIIFFIIVLFSSCKKESKDKKEFELFGQISGDVPDYIFIEYEKIKDSVKIINNHFYFKGHLNHVVRANLYIRPVSSIDASLFIENTKIKLEITVDRETYNNNIVNFIKIKDISGTKTQKIIQDFETFRQANSTDTDWENKLYRKINNIVEQYPKNPYSAELLHRYSSNKSLDLSQIKTIFNKLDENNSEKHYISEVRKLIFPAEKIVVGNNFNHFELPNSGKQSISTSKFKGQFIFIDFWASWCTPCIQQFPKLKKIHNEQYNSDLKIVGVSFDTDIDKWLSALDKNDLPWENLIDQNGLNSDLSSEFGITYLPYNLLIDKSGKIIAIDIKIEDIQPLLDKY